MGILVLAINECSHPYPYTKIHHERHNDNEKVEGADPTNPHGMEFLVEEGLLRMKMMTIMILKLVQMMKQIVIQQKYCTVLFTKFLILITLK